MKCPYCGKTISDNLQYCSNCGQEIASKDIINGEIKDYWNSVDEQNSSVNEYTKKIENEIQAEQKRHTQKYIGAIVALFAIVAVIVYVFMVRPSLQYNKALSLMQEGNYNEAHDIFESLKSYKTSEEELEKCNAALAQLKYENAVRLFESGDVKNAMADFHELGDYSDSEKYYNICEVECINQAKEFETVTYGKFDGEDIKWIVLSKNEREALLIAESYIVPAPYDGERSHDDYNDRWIYHDWSNSSLREWLNGEFLNSFSSMELERICETHLSTEEYDTENYNGWHAEEIVVDTVDRVYIPTAEDVFAYSLFTNSVIDQCGWLRDRSGGIGAELILEEDGSISGREGSSKAMVRPMMNISLEGLESIESETVTDCYNEETPFNEKYWVVYRNGLHDERIEATAVDSTHAPEMLHAILKDYELNINDERGADNWTGYILSDDGQWINDDFAYPLADKTKTIIASNLDIYNDEGNLILAKSKYSDINWDAIN